MKKTIPLSLALLLSATLLAPEPASAQRRIVGGDDEDDEDAEDAKAADEAKAKAKAKAEKDAAAKEKAREAKKKKAEERKKAKEAARKAAEEAKKRKKEEAERKAQEKIDKEKRRLEENQAGRLKAAKAKRQYVRKDGAMNVGVSMLPGAPATDKVVEMRFDVSETLKVASARYGNAKPMSGLRLVAEVEAPKTKKKVETQHYLLHRLNTPGSYGFHFTPTAEGEWTVTVRVADADVGAVNAVIPVYVGTWPPPDFEEEEANNKKAGAKTNRSGRRVIGSK